MQGPEKPGPPRAELFPGETVLTGASYPAIRYCRHGETDKPLAVFIPGGGHMARVAYGHPGSDPEDFLDFWLANAGWGLLALSYPSSHPAFEQAYPRMTITDWGESTAAIVRDTLMTIQHSPRVVLLGWSMAGRMVSAFKFAAARYGIEVEGFVSLSATPPLPYLVPVDPAGEPMTADGLWDTETARAAVWAKDLSEQNQRIGRDVITADAYRRFYRVDNPIRLRGEPDHGATLPGLEATLRDMQAFNYATYPLTGVIAPTGRGDAWHALTDHANWAFLNAQMIYSSRIAGRHGLDRLGEADWDRLQALMRGLPQRLLRVMPGGHLFFLGRSAARAVTRHIVALHAEMQAIDQELASILRG